MRPNGRPVPAQTRRRPSTVTSGGTAAYTVRVPNLVLRNFRNHLLFTATDPASVATLSGDVSNVRKFYADWPSDPATGTPVPDDWPVAPGDLLDVGGATYPVKRVRCDKPNYLVIYVTVESP